MARRQCGKTIIAGVIRRDRARSTSLRVLGRHSRTWDHCARRVLHSSQNCPGRQLRENRNRRHEQDQPQDEHRNATTPTNTSRLSAHEFLLSVFLRNPTCALVSTSTMIDIEKE